MVYNGHPEGAVEEGIALFNETLLASTEREDHSASASAANEDMTDEELAASMAAEGDQYDELPQYRLTGFTFFDREARVLPFYADIIESGRELNMSGYVKPITDDSPLIDGGVAMFTETGVVGWWVAGFDGGEKHVIGVTTEAAHYYLTEPSELYEPFMVDIDTKVFISKAIIEHLIDQNACGEEISYEDLLLAIEERTTPRNVEKITAEAVVKHADFIVSQVRLI